jgi:rubrerythrin
MALTSDMKAPDILAVAVRAEMDAADVYNHLRGRVKNEVLVQKLKFLADEEVRHKAILERLFADKFPARKLAVPAKPARAAKAVPLDETSSVLDLFKLAMAKEKEAEEFYRAAKASIEDAAGRKVLDYLSRVERSHFYMLKSEIDLLDRFPEYFDVEEFHVGQDLFHIGA